MVPNFLQHYLGERWHFQVTYKREITGFLFILQSGGFSSKSRRVILPITVEQEALLVRIT